MATKKAAKKWTEKADDQWDKKRGISENSARDAKVDKTRKLPADAEKAGRK